jgi:hypothetical protein
MELETLIVADAVSTPPDDKFYVHGGGISRLEVPTLPFPMQLGVLLRFKIEKDDLTHSHRVGVVLIGPANVPNVPGIEFDLAPPEELPALAPGEERFANVGMQINGVAVRAGLHRLQVDLDGKRVRDVPIPVIVVAGAEPIPMPREWPQASPPNRERGRPHPAKRKRPPQPPKKRLRK